MSQADDYTRKVLGAGDDFGFAASLAYLRHAGGSGRGAARLAGVGEASLRDWTKGRHPSARNQSRIIAAARDLRTPKATPDAAVVIKVFNTEPKRRNSNRERKVDAGQLQLAPGTMAASRAAYVSGGPVPALKAFLQGIGDDWYRDALTPDEWQEDGGEFEYGMTF